MGEDDYRNIRQKRSARAEGRLFEEPPWHPFKTRSDYDFAELVFRSSMTKRDIGQLLTVVRRCIGGQDQLTFGNYDDLDASWREAAHLVAPVCCRYCFDFCRVAVV